jgi:Common central domain of tyrosinase
MRGSFLSLLLATGAVAAVMPRDDPEGDNINTGPPPKNDIPVFNTHKWPLLDPTQALSALHQKATQTPSAVSILPGVPLPTNWNEIVESIDHGLKHEFQSLSHDASSVTEQWIEENVSRPEKLEPQANQLPKHPPTEEASKVMTEAAAPAGSCASLQTHYEWNNLTPQHKTQFLSAIKCLYTKPPRSGLPGVQNRWDDLAAIHQHMSPIIHNVGQFLPWHRYFLKIFENELRGTCGYTGPMTWWDETKDAGHFQSSPLATQQYFGHLPDGPAVCIISGVRVPPLSTYNKHPLTTSLGIREHQSPHRPRLRQQQPLPIAGRQRATIGGADAELREHVQLVQRLRGHEQLRLLRPACVLPRCGRRRHVRRGHLARRPAVLHAPRVRRPQLAHLAERQPQPRLRDRRLHHAKLRQQLPTHGAQLRAELPQFLP